MSEGTPAQRMRLALDLAETGEAMLRQRLRRKHPACSAAEIEARCALSLIVARGFGRERELVKAFDELLRDEASRSP
jgi:hypothetical protein